MLIRIKSQESGGVRKSVFCFNNDRVKCVLFLNDHFLKFANFIDHLGKHQYS